MDIHQVDARDTPAPQLRQSSRGDDARLMPEFVCYAQKNALYLAQGATRGAPAAGPPDVLLRNDGIANGQPHFTDVTDSAGISFKLDFNIADSISAHPCLRPAR